MMKNVVLIDYQNVPREIENLDLLSSADCEVWVFLGPNQKKVPAALLNGPRVKPIRISRDGDNAADFHIAFYLGRMSRDEQPPYFHIISKDKGFDPLCKHMKEKSLGLHIERVESIEEVLFVKAKAAIEKDCVAYVLNRLSRVHKPKKLKTLRSSARRWLEGDEALAEKVIKTMKARKLISVDANDNVTYPGA